MLLAELVRDLNLLQSARPATLPSSTSDFYDQNSRFADEKRITEFGDAVSY